jgi:hypothetical protein
MPHRRQHDANGARSEQVMTKAKATEAGVFIIILKKKILRLFFF